MSITTRRRLTVIGCLIVGVPAWFFSGLSGLAWTSQPDWLVWTARAASSIVVISLFVLYVRSWVRTHGRAVRDEHRVALDQFPDFIPYTSSGLLDALAQPVVTAGLLDTPLKGRSYDRLIHALCRASERRYKGVENVVISATQSSHTLAVRWRKHSAAKVHSGWVLPIMRPFKNQALREVDVTAGERLGSFETLALLLVLGTRSQQLPDSANGPAATLLRRHLLDLMAGPLPDFANNRATPHTVLHAAIHARDEATAAGLALLPVSPYVHEFLDLITERRPYIAYYETQSPPRHTQVAFRQDSFYPTPPPPYDRWRLAKDRWRHKLRFPPRVVYLSLDVARGMGSYELHVQCDEDLYIEQAEVWSAGANTYLRPQPRTSHNKAFISWEDRSRGRAFFSLGAARLHATSPTKPWLAIRLTEKPPGTLGAAAAVALTTLIAVWLVGARPHGDVTKGVDFVALILGIPAVASTVLGLRAAGGKHGLRSLTAVLSLLASLAVSLFAIVLYLREGKQGLAALGGPKHAPHDFYFVTEWPWVALFSLQSALLAVTFGTFAMRLLLYANVVDRRGDLSA